jgi:hypothetical protein
MIVLFYDVDVEFLRVLRGYLRDPNITFMATNETYWEEGRAYHNIVLTSNQEFYHRFKHNIFWLSTEANYQENIEKYMFMYTLCDTIPNDSFYNEIDKIIEFARLFPCSTPLQEKKVINELLYIIKQRHQISIPNFLANRDIEETISAYFSFIHTFFKQENSSVYTLGDSLDKFSFIWNLLEDKKIKTIPFSGNMYDVKEEELKLNHDKLSLMMENFQNLVANNIEFRNMVQDLNSGKNVLITDYGHSGRALVTIIALLNLNGISMETLTYYQLCFIDEKIKLNNLVSHALKEMGHIPIKDIIIFEGTLDFYLIDSDSLNLSERRGISLYSRCIPSYPVEKWHNPLDENSVWSYNKPRSDGTSVNIGNYYQCNINRIITAIQLSCVVLRLKYNDYNISTPIIISKVPPIKNMSILQLTGPKELLRLTGPKNPFILSKLGKSRRRARKRSKRVSR